VSEPKWAELSVVESGDAGLGRAGGASQRRCGGRAYGVHDGADAIIAQGGIIAADVARVHSCCRRGLGVAIEAGSGRRRRGA